MIHLVLSYNPKPLENIQKTIKNLNQSNAKDCLIQLH